MIASDAEKSLDPDLEPLPLLRVCGLFELFLGPLGIPPIIAPIGVGREMLGEVVSLSRAGRSYGGEMLDPVILMALELPTVPEVPRMAKERVWLTSKAQAAESLS